MNNEKSLQTIQNDEKLITYNDNVSIGMLADDSIIAIAEQVEKRVAALNKIMVAALKITTPLDWCIIGGTPYLQESGAAKVARLFGVSWQVDEPKKEMRADGHYIYHYHGRFSFGGSTIDAEGVRASYDDFFTGKKNPKSPDEVDVRDVKLAAYTNCINNGVKRIIPGLKNITIDTLRAAGFDTSKLKGYGFNSSAPQEESEDSKDKRKEIENMLNEMSGGNQEIFSNGLKKYTSFTAKDGTKFAGYASLDKVSEKAIPVTYGKIKEAYDTWKDKQADADNSKNDEV